MIQFADPGDSSQGATGAVIRGNYFHSGSCNTPDGPRSYDSGTRYALIEHNVVDTRLPWGIELYSDEGSTVRHNTVRWYPDSQCAFNGTECGNIDITRKSDDPPGRGTRVYDNVGSVAIRNGSTVARNDHDLDPRVRGVRRAADRPQRLPPSGRRLSRKARGLRRHRCWHPVSQTWPGAFVWTYADRPFWHLVVEKSVLGARRAGGRPGHRGPRARGGRSGRDGRKAAARSDKAAIPRKATWTCDRTATTRATLSTEFEASSPGQTLCLAGGRHGVFRGGVKRGPVPFAPARARRRGCRLSSAAPRTSVSRV